LWELPAGEAAYPFHFSDTELVIVVRGRPTLREFYRRDDAVEYWDRERR
jgi:hypothetical protein